MNEKPVEETAVSACGDCGHKENKLLTECPKCNSKNIASAKHTRFQGGGTSTTRGHIVTSRQFNNEA